MSKKLIELVDASTTVINSLESALLEAQAENTRIRALLQRVVVDGLTTVTINPDGEPFALVDKPLFDEIVSELKERE